MQFRPAGSLRRAQHFLWLSVKLSLPLLPQRPCWDGLTAIAEKRSSHWVAPILPLNFDPCHFTSTVWDPKAFAVIPKDFPDSHPSRYFASVLKRVAMSSWEQLVSFLKKNLQGHMKSVFFDQRKHKTESLGLPCSLSETLGCIDEIFQLGVRPAIPITFSWWPQINWNGTLKEHFPTQGPLSRPHIKADRK